MAKRGLCLLLAVLAAFSLTAPALAAEEEPAAIEEPGGEEPAATEEPGEEEPTATEKPDGEEPAATEKPDAEEPSASTGAASGACGEGVTYTLAADGVLTVSGSGAISDEAFKDRSDIVSAVIQKGVTAIGADAFSNCTGLTSVTILEPDCVVCDDAGRTPGFPETVVVHGYAGSTAEAYAEEYGCAFESITVDAPVLIGAENVANGVKIRWNAVPGAAKYRVYYKGGGARSWTKIAETVDSSLVWTGAESGVEYTFTVKAYDSRGKAGGYDKSGTGVTFYATPTVKIALASGGGIDVSWSRVDGASRYAVYYRENGGSWKKIGTTTKTSYTRAASKLKSGATYQFMVRCCENDRITMLSAYEASGSLEYYAVPTVKIALASGGGIKVSWDKIGGADRYLVYYKENGGGWHKIGSTTKTSYTRAASKLKNGVTYQFTVRCCAGDKKTPLSSYAASNSLKYYAAPTVKIAIATNGVKVSWNKIGDAPRYAVYYRENGGAWHKIGTTAKTSYTRKAAKLKNGVTYQFMVRCCENDKTTMLSSYTVSNSLKYYAAPTVKIRTTASGGIEVSWNKVSGVNRYAVYYRENGGAWKKIGTTTKTSYTRKASKLKNGVTYQFTVRCVKDNKTTMLSPYKASGSLKHLATPKVKITSVPDGAQVSWNEVDGASRYVVYYKVNGGSWKKIGTTTKTSYTRAASKLKSGATYQFAVRCVTDDKKTLLSGYKASDTLLDLSTLKHSGVARALEQLKELPDVDLVRLPPQSDGASGLTLKDVGKFQTAFPSVLFDYRFTLCGKNVSTLDKTLNLSHIKMTDRGAEVRKALPYMTLCTTLDMDSCGVSNEDMAAIRDDFPDIKVIWRVWFGRPYTCRTDAKKILASMGDGSINGENIMVLKYCTEVRYLDLGHNPNLDDISFVRYMPDLEVAILAINSWTDASPLASCPKLEYLEIFNTKCTDLSPLSGLKNLRHLNVAYLKSLTDVSPLMGMTWLERLWVGRDNQVPVKDLEALKAALPNCEVNITNRYDPTGDGWRRNERYYLLRQQFGYDTFDFSTY